MSVERVSDEIRSGDDVDALLIHDPDEYHRRLKAFNALAANGVIESDNLTIAAIPQTIHLDKRRYSMGLDRITAGMSPLHAGELIVVGAREGHGKTSLGERAALKNSREHRVLFVTLEMSREEIRDRMLAKLMRTSIHGVYAEREEDSKDYLDAYDELAARDMLIWRPTLKKERTPGAIFQRALDLGAAFLVVDYSRMLVGWKPGDAAAEIVDEFGAFVRSSFVTTMLLTQLNREAALRRPHSGNLQDTGKLEQAADRVVLLWRPYLGQGPKDRICEVIVSKNRHGPAFRGHAGWTGSTLDFYSYTEAEEATAPCCHKKTKTTDD